MSDGGIKRFTLDQSWQIEAQLPLAEKGHQLTTLQEVVRDAVDSIPKEAFQGGPHFVRISLIKRKPASHKVAG
jgi:hypothetical protein